MVVILHAKINLFYPKLRKFESNVSSNREQIRRPVKQKNRKQVQFIVLKK